MSDLPNVVVIMSDQQRADGYGPGRHPCADYPAMEELCRQSVNFSRFYTAASPCVPSRNVFLTGRNEWISGVHGNSKFLVGDETTWMSILRDHGYHCVSVGKTHMVHAGSFHLQVPVGLSFADETQSFNHFRIVASPEPEESYYDLQVAARAREAIKLLKSKQPFALFVGFHGPHQPYIMPEKYIDFVKPEDVPLPETWKIDSAAKSKAFNRKRERLLRVYGGELDEKALRIGIAGYHCLLKLIDDGLSMVMDELDSQSLLDESLIVYCSDHGDLLGEHGLFNKAASFYEGEVRIPFTVRLPGGRLGGRQVARLASSLDFVPTLFDVIGLQPDISLPGRSLMPAIERNESVRDSVLCSVGPGLMIRTERHKLWYSSLDEDGEMYDLQLDPLEARNIYRDAGAETERTRLFMKMLRKRMTEDLENNEPTERAMRLKGAMSTTLEPESIPRNSMPKEILEHIDSELQRKGAAGGQHRA